MQSVRLCKDNNNKIMLRLTWKLWKILRLMLDLSKVVHRLSLVYCAW
jgi:hypothetical protein